MSCLQHGWCGQARSHRHRHWLRAAVFIVMVALAPAQHAATSGHLSPPILLRIDGRSEARTLDGVVIPLPAGVEIDLCALGYTVFAYDTASRTLRLARPCLRDDVFRSGFEP